MTIAVRSRTFILLAALAGAAPALAQTPPPAAAVNPLLETARLAFEALPLDERKAIQDDLSWTSTYTGSLDGTFGRGSFDAIVAFELKARLKADGIVEPRERAALAAEATKLRALVGFQVIRDPRTGMRIGLPLKAIEATAARGRGTAWTRKDGQMTVTSETYKAGEADLAAMFEQLKAEQPGRKVTYAVLRPAWFVVAGETQTRKFYSRYASGNAGIVGYTYGYDRTVPDGDRMAVIIANSFDPFPGEAPPVAAAPGTPGTQAVAAKPGAPGPGAPVAPPKPQPIVASGLVVGSGRVVVPAMAAEGCSAITVAGRPATVARVDAEAGLALLQGDAAAAAAAAVAFRVAAPGIADPLVVLAQAERGAGGGVVVAPGDTVAAPSGGKSEFRVLTPLQPGGVGATVVDRSGAVAGLVAGLVSETRRVAGVVPEAAHEVVGATAIARFLVAAGVPARAAAPGPARTAGEIASALRGAVVQVVCTR